MLVGADLWSIANPTHEQRIGELLAEHLPGVAVSLSHAVNPSIREYRRASATCIDASLKPLMGAYLETMGGKRFRSGQWPAAEPPVYPKK